ncbi:MAG: CYTH domain-containing protein [Leeuwenhoekiella sp.]
MALLEIERKFLVRKSTFKNLAFAEKRLTQGYLNSDPHRTVRVRIADETAFITIKGIPDEGGTTRFEWEKPIPVQEAQSLLSLCEKGTIDKTRYLIKVGKHTYEVDEFYGENEGLILAEIELQAAEEFFTKPDWLGKEVTGDLRYYNSQLSKNPFKSW